MTRICIFCGSSSGARPEYAAAARATAVALAARGIGLVYGGGRVGLMGELADEMLRRGGEVAGVIPRLLFEREVGHTGVTQLHVVETMHQRKALMAELSDGFIALPGGLGTLEEICEIWTWAQLGSHRKPLGFLDAAGYYAPLLDFIARAATEGFIRPKFRDLAVVDDDIERLLDRFAAYEPPAPLEQWIDHART
jgi:uncharacterized protein (TIGR00730 family)